MGGRSDFVFTAKPWALITCARAPSNLCVIDEPTDDREQAIVSVLDPDSRRGRELFRYKLDSKDISSFSAISPEGKRIAYIPSNAGPIFVRSLAGDPTMEIPVRGWSNLQNLTWSADGKALYLSADTSGGKALLHIDLHAKVNAIWENLGASAETIAVPSPDGRHLAMQSWTSTSNMWMLENF